METVKDIFNEFEVSNISDNFLNLDIHELTIGQITEITKQTGIGSWEILRRILNKNVNSIHYGKFPIRNQR